MEKFLPIGFRSGKGFLQKRVHPRSCLFVHDPNSFGSKLRIGTVPPEEDELSVYQDPFL
jgi:hypothetical protein